MNDTTDVDTYTWQCSTCSRTVTLTGDNPRDIDTAMRALTDRHRRAHQAIRRAS